MAGRGELYRRKDGKWTFRVKASNGQVVAVGQGYAAKSSARATLQKLLEGAYAGPITEVDG